MASSKIISFLLVLAAYLSVCSASIFSASVRVNITNEIGGGHTLTLHCKSGDDDLGVHHLTPHHTFSFHFHDSVFSNTLFFCDFSWPGASHRFDIFYSMSDPCTKCVWKIKPTGPCRDAFDYFPPACFKWNQKRNKTQELEGSKN